MATGTIRNGEVNPEWDAISALRINHNVELVLPREKLYGTIENMEPVPFLSVSDSTWALADGAVLEVGSYNDYLEPSEHQFYALLFGMHSDVSMDVKVRILGSTGDLYGVKNEPEALLNPTSAPYYNPRIVVKGLKGKAVPSFRLENHSRQDASLVKFGFQGWKFTIPNISNNKIAGTLTSISLAHIGETYR